jgi:putative hydrolase of the HAD superfamily
MDHCEVRAVLFDFGGVIADEGFANGLTSLAVQQALEVKDITSQGMQAVYDSGFVLGKGSAADFWAMMRQRTGIIGDDDFLSSYIIDGFKLRYRMIELVQKLRSQGYITGILSDQTLWLNELDRRYGFFREFDHVYNSFYLGKGKRDPSLFSDVADDLKLQACEILFIDDNKDNVKHAGDIGMKSILFTNYWTLMTDLNRLLQVNFNHLIIS